MEKVLWIRSSTNMTATKAKDGLEVVNDYLEKGWTVKHISACAMGDNTISGQAYIVIEKKE